MTSQPFDADAWLGTSAGDVTDAQREQIAAAAAAIAERYPEDDLADARESALNAAAEVILGDDELEAIARRHLAQRRILAQRHATLTGALIATCARDPARPARRSHPRHRSQGSREALTAGCRLHQT